MTGDVGARIAEFMAEHLTEAEYARMFSPEGLARQVIEPCPDGWRVGYTTGRIRHGRHEGKFACFAFKPVGKGARSGKAETWVRVYFRTFSKRKAARARCLELLAKHHPAKWGGATE